MGFAGMPVAFAQMPAAIAHKPNSRFIPQICRSSWLPAIAADTRQVVHWFQQSAHCRCTFNILGRQMRPARPIVPSRMVDSGRRQMSVIVSQAVAMDEMIDSVPAAAATAPPAVPQNVDGVCQSGLNGLTAGGTDGLDTGCFHVAAQQPVLYTVQESMNLLSLDNMNLLRGLLPDSFPARLAAEPSTEKQRRFIIIDEAVHAIYGPQLEKVHHRKYMQYHGVEYEILALPTNEPNKSFNLVFQLAERLEAFKLNRRKEPIIAIGGGVCLDVAGLAANLYRRNTPLIKIPTTVMAAVDASIGIKTAVNFHGRKNKMGTYCAPLAVFIDKTFLKTLDKRHLSNGSAEILKMACIKDRELFELLEKHSKDLVINRFQSPEASTIMRRSIQGMLEELEYNLWEHILQRLVDYGHAFSPEIEMAAMDGDEAVLLHGEAVNIDMALTTQLAYQRGMITKDERERVFNVMRSLGLALWHEVCTLDLLMQGLEDTTRQRDGHQRVPYMKGIGGAEFINDITREEVAQAAQYVSQLHAQQLTEAAHNNGYLANSITPLEPVPQSVKQHIREPVMAQ